MTAQSRDKALPRSRLGRAGRWTAIAVIAAFMALLVYGVRAQSPDRTIDDNLAHGRATRAPGFTLKLLAPGRPGAALGGRVRRAAADGQVALEELRGTPVVLNFWASWCAPCAEEAPRLESGWRAARARGVLYLGLDMQDVTDDAHAFLRRFAVSYPNVRDPSNAVARRWGATGIPETFFIGRRGDVVGHVIGVVSKQQLAEGVAAAVAGRPRPAGEGGARRSTR